MQELSRRDFVQRAVAAGIGLGAAPTLLGATAFQSPSSQQKPSADAYAMVDPELVPLLKTITTKSFNKDLLPAERSQTPWPPLPAPAPQPQERFIPGPPGNPKLRVVIIDPAPGTKRRPAFLHIHGGGFIAGCAAQFTTVCKPWP
jgi:acetyl esterase/lipase